MIIKKGEKYPGILPPGEGAIFNIDKSLNAHFIVNFLNPSAHEIAQFAAQKRFEIREGLIKDSIFFTVKIGNLEWMDAFFSPHLAAEFDLSQKIQSGQGLALTLMLIDARDNTVKSMRLIGLDKDFSMQLYSDIAKLMEMPFTSKKYNSNINSVLAQYDTVQLASVLHNRFELKKK